MIPALACVGPGLSGVFLSPCPPFQSSLDPLGPLYGDIWPNRFTVPHGHSLLRVSLPHAFTRVPLPIDHSTLGPLKPLILWLLVPWGQLLDLPEDHGSGGAISGTVLKS